MNQKLVKLAPKIHENRMELGVYSPIHALKDLNMTEFGTGVTEASSQRKVAKEAERTAQESNGRAASLLGTAPGQHLTFWDHPHPRPVGCGKPGQ